MNTEVFVVLSVIAVLLALAVEIGAANQSHPSVSPTVVRITVRGAVVLVILAAASWTYNVVSW